jgi:type IV pilus biogenesis protein CpaD/CtpE
MRHTFLFSLKSVAAMLLVLAGCAASCKHDGGKTAALPAGSTAATKAQFDILRDSVDLKWRKMTESDDQKIGVTRLLLRELQGKPGIDAAQVQGLERANARLKTRRYNQQTMASSELIDQYDNAQDSLLHALYPVAAPNGNAPTETARDFVEGIQQIDAGVVPFRLQYNQAARQYNEYLKLHQPEIQSLGGKYAEAKPLPLF